jgi:putative ABC transport system permease protein
VIPLSYNVRSLFVRRGTTLAAVGGIALVVFVFSASLMLSAGVQSTLAVSGKSDHAVVLRKGSDGELASGIEVDKVAMITAAPGVRKGADNQPIAVGEVMVVAAMNKAGVTNSVSNVAIRGVPETVWAFRPEVKIIAGRQPRPGTDEAAVGKRVQGRFTGLELNQTVELKKNRPVTVVGIFEAGGSAYESEVWVDIHTLAQSFGRLGAVSSVRVALDSASSFDAFQAAVESDKRLGLAASREQIFYEKQTEGTAGLMSAMGSVISFFFAVGAIIGAMITMYASIAHRQREIGTMRALGFRRRTILGSFLLESTLIALVGGALGAAGALALGATEFTLVNQANWSEMVFRFTPTTATLTTALVVSCVMGIFGGFLPALRAARLSPVKAMRD